MELIHSVSIGIPTCGRVDLLQRAVESARRQDYPLLEILISDNASTDTTAEFCAKAAANDPRIRYFRNPVNLGAAYNFTRVLRESKGEFFLWLGDDDELAEDYVSECVAFFSTHPRHSVVGGVVSYVQDDATAFRGENVTSEDPDPSTRVLAYLEQVVHNGIFYGLCRRSYLANTPLRERFGADWLLVSGLAFLGPVRTIESTEIRRRRGGATRDLQTLLKSVGQRPMGRTRAWWMLAVDAFADVAWRSQAYRGISSIERLELAWKTYSVLCRKKGVSAIRVLREELALRSRARALVQRWL